MFGSRTSGWFLLTGLYLLGCLVLAACVPAAHLANQAAAAAPTVPPSAAPSQAAPLQAADALPTPTPSLNTAQPAAEQADLTDYILRELVGQERLHLLVAQVAPTGNTHSPLDKSLKAIQRCWLYQDSELQSCRPEFFDQNYRQEKATWKYAYLAFAINQRSPDGSQAALQIDRIPGPTGGNGELIELVNQQGWQIQSQRKTWVR